MLLGDPALARRMGDAAHERVRDHFLGPHHLGLYFALIERLTALRGTARGSSAPAAAPR
jgi:hypothetical protein